MQWVFFYKSTVTAQNVGLATLISSPMAAIGRSFLEFQEDTYISRMRRIVRERSSISNIGLMTSEKSVELVDRAILTAVYPQHLPEQRSPSSNQHQGYSLRCSSSNDWTMSPSEFRLEKISKVDHTLLGDHCRYHSEESSPSSTTSSSERSVNSIAAIVDQRPESVHRSLLNKAERSGQLKDRKQDRKERRKRRRSRLINELKRNISKSI